MRNVLGAPFSHVLFKKTAAKGNIYTGHSLPLIRGSQRNKLRVFAFHFQAYP
jgi:hypothetical protein